MLHHSPVRLALGVGCDTFKMRTRKLSTVGFRCCLVRTQPPARERFQFGLAIKPRVGHADVWQAFRSRCDYVIVDAHDGYTQTPSFINRPCDYWPELYSATQFDCLVVTSRACRDFVLQYLPRARVEVIQHQYDPAALKGFYDPDGPVVYVGRTHFLADVDMVTKACELLGRRFITALGDLRLLQGASLVIAVRNSLDYELNRWCKPLVKMENAAAAGLPVLASDHPCITSEFPEAYVTNRLDTLDDWVLAIHEALQSPRLVNRGHDDKWCAAQFDKLCRG